MVAPSILFAEGKIEPADDWKHVGLKYNLMWDRMLAGEFNCLTLFPTIAVFESLIFNGNPYL